MEICKQLAAEQLGLLMPLYLCVVTPCGFSNLEATVWPNFLQWQLRVPKELVLSQGVGSRERTNTCQAEDTFPFITWVYFWSILWSHILVTTNIVFYYLKLSQRPIQCSRESNIDSTSWWSCGKVLEDDVSLEILWPFFVALPPMEWTSQSKHDLSWPWRWYPCE